MPVILSCWNRKYPRPAFRPNGGSFLDSAFFSGFTARSPAIPGGMSVRESHERAAGPAVYGRSLAPFEYQLAAAVPLGQGLPQLEVKLLKGAGHPPVAVHGNVAQHRHLLV